MKKVNLYIKSILILATTLSIMSCKKDYLNTLPTDSTSPATVFSSIENVRGAVNGLSRAMKTQYIDSQGFNGEGTIKMYYGNYSGNHFSVPLPGWSSVINMEYFNNPQSTYDYYPWYYYYKIIGNANSILVNIDGVTGDQKEKDFLKAQTLCFRAYCYFMLSQLYGDRWIDSNNGGTDAVILRTIDNLDDMPLSTLAQTYDFVYKDLDDAISLYQSSGLNRASTRNYEMNLDVAYAIYARAAITKHDYPNAEKYASLAKQNYPLMNATAYKAGFSNPTSEWIWSIYDNDQETIYFFSFGAYIGYNSTAGNVRSTPKSISKELFNSIPLTDIRRTMFLDPAIAPSYATFNATTGQGNTSGSQNSLTYVRSLYPSIQTTAVPYAYMQLKIAINTAPGVSHVPNFRSSEMYLIEAEAKYFQNKSVTDIQTLLNQLTKTSGRDPNYNCTATGTALLEEIKKYRAIELWGEGYDFFDMKRWGDEIVRKSFTNGGNFQTSLAVTIKPDQNNKWKLVVPQRETDYNTLLK